MPDSKWGAAIPMEVDGKPLVSVIAVTNRPGFTPGLLTMLKAQTWHPRELILVDGSPDGSCMAQALADGQSWMTPNTVLDYVHVKPTTPVPVMRNIGLEMARGEYQTWMDDDGWHAPHHIETMIGHLEAMKIDAVGIQGLYWATPNGDFFHYRGTPNFPISGSMVWRRKCADMFKFNEGHRRASDHYWINEIRQCNDLTIKAVEDLTVCVGVSHGFNLSNPKPPQLARPISTKSWDDFNPKEEWGLKAHLSRINQAVRKMGGVK